jgi:hypothetical protein
MIRNRNIDRGKATEFWPANSFDAVYNTSQLMAVAAGDPTWGEVNSLGFIGIVIHDDGDSASRYIPFPRHFDETKPIKVYIHYTHSQAAADSPIWKLHYKKQTEGSAMTVSSMTTITFDADVGTATAYGLEVSGAEVIAGNTFTRGGQYVFTVELDSHGTASSDELYFLGLEWEYTPNISLD